MIDNIDILNFIFHVVHHGKDEPMLLDSTPITGYESFFKNRILECIIGNKFQFNNDSELLKLVRKIDVDTDQFVPVSKLIAIEFHGKKDKRIKAGVIIVIRARIEGEVKYILIKYDHENVLTYVKNGNNAVLQEIENTFSKSRTALQKSAIIDISDEELTEVVVVDKTNRNHITNFFKEFLHVNRTYTKQGLTKKLRKAFINTVKQYKNELPRDFTSTTSERFYNVVQNNDSFVKDDFLKVIMGEYYKEEMEIAFRRQLKKEDIQGEEFPFDKDIPKPTQKKFITAEGVKIQYPQVAQDTVEINNTAEATIVTITTNKLIEDHASD